MKLSSMASIRLTKIIATIVMLIFGIALIAMPQESSELLARGVGLVLVLGGVITIVGYMLTKERTFFDVTSMVGGVIVGIAGVIFLINPAILVNFFNFVFGIFILAAGIINIIHTISIVRLVTPKWWIHLLINIVISGVGVLVLVNPFSATNTIMIFIGIALIITALSEIFNLWFIKKPKVIEIIKD